MFACSSIMQVDYFANVGRMIAQSNYAKPEITSLHNYHNKILGVVINQSYGSASIQHCASIAWPVALSNVVGIEYVAAIYDKVIVGIFKVLSYEKRRCDGEIMFKLEVADIRMQNDWLGRRINHSLINGKTLYF